jgi:thiamine-monophosphate kinase
MSEKRTEIFEIGEFGLINRIKASFTDRDPSTILSIGDDAAVIDSGDHYTLLSSDMMVEGIDFDLAYFPLQHLGYKAVVMNISDIAAMNGTPRQILVNIGISNRFSVESVDLLYEGVRRACGNYNIVLVGGDTTSSRSGMIISISILGTIEKKKLARRSGAGLNDIICVSGDLGASFLGLQVLQREKEVFLTNPEMQPDLDQYEHIVHKHLKPEARTDIVHELAKLEIIPSAMIDISDGLASDLMHICTQSAMGAVIFEDKLPVDPVTYKTALEFKIDPSTAALNGGEDYELLFTITQGDFDKLKSHDDIHLIGYIAAQENGIHLVTRNNNKVPLTAQGWDHFRK